MNKLLNDFPVSYQNKKLFIEIQILQSEIFNTFLVSGEDEKSSLLKKLIDENLWEKMNKSNHEFN